MSPNIPIEEGSFSGTFVHPAILVLTIVACILITIMNNRHSIILMIFLSIIIPLGQKIEIFNLNFHIFRVILLVGWIKIIFNKNFTLGKMEKTDKLIIYWVLVSFMAYIIQQDKFSAVINRLGFAYNALGVYFLYRILIKRKEDINTIINTLAFITVVIAICMLNEQRTGKNMFYIFGGVLEFTPVRMGQLRSQGPFAHSITAGVFGATMFPLYFSMWRHKWGSAFFGIIGTVSACVIVITASSATALIAAVSGFAAILFWPLRKHMRMVRYGALFIFVILQIIMISPVWGLIKDIDVMKGASGLHRFMLVDNLINRFTQWFLFGFSSPEKWGFGMEDRANQYYSEALSGGFFKITLFIIIIVASFRIIGEKVKTIKDTSSRRKFWALGSCLFVNLVAFMGIAYWDQMLFIWYLILALITSACLVYSEEQLAVSEMYKKLREGAKQRLTVSSECPSIRGSNSID
jgi:hypothetical protein